MRRTYHLEKRVVIAVFSDIVEIIVLATRTNTSIQCQLDVLGILFDSGRVLYFWVSTARLRGYRGDDCATVPKKMGLNWFMPADAVSMDREGFGV